MKKTLFAGLILAGSGLLFSSDLVAQTPWLSKDVQKIANKEQLEKEKDTNSNIQVVSVDQSWVQSKGVSLVAVPEKQSVGNVQSTDYPQVAISKGVHQDKSKKVKQEQPDYEMRPAITGNK